VPVPNLAALAASALLAAMIGQGAYFVAIKHADASRVVPFTASYPVVALILGILVLHEPLTVPKVAGTALVLCGLMLLAGVFGK
jgi:transporter family protein